MKGWNRIHGSALAIAGLALLLAAAGCSDSTKPNTFDPPESLSVVNGNLSVALGWSASPDEGNDKFQQYNIYRHTSSLGAMTESQIAQYKIGTVQKGVYAYTDHFSTNGVRYYYHVRAQKTDGSLSGASNEILGAGRTEGTGKIIEEFVSEGDSGFNFLNGQTVSLKQTNPDRFNLTDLYLGTTAQDDASTSPLALKSPEMLADLNAEWIGKDADIKEVGTDFDITTTQAPGAGWANSQSVVEGTVYAVKTPSGNYAKIKILDIEGQAGSRKITFKYAYQPTAGLVLF